jgi:AraC-like DNA-binding protein
VLITQHVNIADHLYCELYAEPLVNMELQLTVTEPVIIMEVIMSGGGKIAMQYMLPGVSYAISLTAGQKYRAIYFQTPFSLLEGLADTYPPLNDLVMAMRTQHPAALHLPHIRLNTAIRGEIEKMKNCPLSGQARIHYYNNRISDVVIAYLDDMQRVTLQDSRLILLHEKEIDEFIEKVDRYPEEHVNVEECAHALGLTERALENAFKLKLGSTVKIYVLQQRVEKAKHLLLDTMQTVTDIAMEVGYADPSYFIRVFKQTEGVTPGKYRSDNSAIM